MQELGSKRIFHDLGPTGIILGSQRNGKRVPFARDSDVFVSKGIPKIYIHPDQIFYSKVNGNVFSCFSYCHKITELPIEIRPDNQVLFEENGLIAIELSRACKIIGVRYSGYNGEYPIRVLTGNCLSAMSHKFNLDNQDGGEAVSPGQKSDLYKIVVFEAEPGTQMPMVELVSNTAVPTMPNKAWQPILKTPAEMLATMEGTRLGHDDLNIFQKTIIVHKLVSIDSEWISHPENPRLLRLSANEVDGLPVSYDDILAVYKKDLGLPTDAALRCSDIEVAIDQAWYIITRYGKHKRLKRQRNRKQTPAAHDMEYIYKNPMGFTRHPTQRYGVGLLDSLMLWPKTPIADPEEYADFQVVMFETCKSADIATPVYSIPMLPDRNIFYFSYRYGVDQLGQIPFDCLIVLVESEKDLAQVPDFMAMVNHYIPNQPKRLLVNFDISPERWPGLIYFGMAMCFEKVILTNEERLYEKKRVKNSSTEVAYEPNQFYHGFIDWWDSVKHKKPTQIQIIEEGTRVVTRIDENPSLFIEHFMQSWDCDSNINHRIGGVPLSMPISNTFVHRVYRSLETNAKVNQQKKR